MLIHSYKPSCFGFGDFLRGHIALLQKFGIPNVSMSLQQTNLATLFKAEKFTTHNPNINVNCDIWHKDKSCLNNISSNDAERVICCNHFFTFPISSEIKEHMKNLLELNDKTYYRVIHLLKHLNLDLYNFNVLHIRNSSELTRNALVDTTLSNQQYKNILNVIEEHSLNDTRWFICTDTFSNKLLFKRKDVTYLDCKPKHSSIHHSVPLDVLCDHFIMRYSNKIIQITDVGVAHFWGSGYSDSVNWLYDVPITHYDLEGNRKNIYVTDTEALNLIT